MMALGAVTGLAVRTGRRDSRERALRGFRGSDGGSYDYSKYYVLLHEAEGPI